MGMNILVIKQTSLGDVLHVSGHIRSIKKHHPRSKLFLLTANTSADIYRHSPWVDELILVDRDGIKENWRKKPMWAMAEMMRTMSQVRAHQFDLAIDFQGLAKSVFFLYGAKAENKFVKGNWWGLKGFRNKNLHAIKEMDQLLQVAGIPTTDTSMELAVGADDKWAIDQLLLKINPERKPMLIVSPFSRWPSKDWPLENYMQVGEAVSNTYQAVFTGTPDRKMHIDQAIADGGRQMIINGAVNLAGALSLLEFAELVARASLMLTGDSFPMHVAAAKQTPVIALFGPTDENKVGPLGARDRIMRAPGCDVCDKRHCPRHCLSRLHSDEVIRAINLHAP